MDMWFAAQATFPLAVLIGVSCGELGHDPAKSQSCCTLLYPYPEIFIPMTTKKPFLQAGFLDYLVGLSDVVPLSLDESLPDPLVRTLVSSDGTGALTKAVGSLIQLLGAQRAMLQASFDTELAADELRRYQKFARPGQPSPHIVQLRQKQAAARQATNQSKQSFLKAALAFSWDAGIEVPPRMTLEKFIVGWIDVNVPKGFLAAG
jgi:hypothetical protein